MHWDVSCGLATLGVEALDSRLCNYQLAMLSNNA
jgi:hypothetical protein